MGPVDLNVATWCKSTYSNPDGGACVEVARNVPDAAPVRDSKAPHRPALIFPRPVFASFVRAVRGGEFDVS